MGRIELCRIIEKSDDSEAGRIDPAKESDTIRPLSDDIVERMNRLHLTDEGQPKQTMGALVKENEDNRTTDARNILDVTTRDFDIFDDEYEPIYFSAERFGEIEEIEREGDELREIGLSLMI